LLRKFRERKGSEKMKKQIVIAIVGGKSSGKTTTIEVLTRELSKKGYKIAAIKHISEPNFTIDTLEKDTWRFAQAGAETIISVASGEIATIEKVNAENLPLNVILEKCKDKDIIFLEGFRKTVSKNKNIPKIVTVKSAADVSEALEQFQPIIAFTGTYPGKEANVKIPYVDVVKNPEEIALVVERYIQKKVFK